MGACERGRDAVQGASAGEHRCSLDLMRKHCAQRLQQRLSDPHVRAEKALECPTGAPYASTQSSGARARLHSGPPQLHGSQGQNRPSGPIGNAGPNGNSGARAVSRPRQRAPDSARCQMQRSRPAAATREVAPPASPHCTRSKTPLNSRPGSTVTGQPRLRARSATQVVRQVSASEASKRKPATSAAHRSSEVDAKGGHGEPVATHVSKQEAREETQPHRVDSLGGNGGQVTMHPSKQELPEEKNLHSVVRRLELSGASLDETTIGPSSPWLADQDPSASTAPSCWWSPPPTTSPSSVPSTIAAEHFFIADASSPQMLRSPAFKGQQEGNWDQRLMQFQDVASSLETAATTIRQIIVRSKSVGLRLEARRGGLTPRSETQPLTARGLSAANAKELEADNSSSMCDVEQENAALRQALEGAERRLQALEGEKNCFMVEGVFDLVNTLCRNPTPMSSVGGA